VDIGIRTLPRLEQTFDLSVGPGKRAGFALREEVVRPNLLDFDRPYPVNTNTLQANNPTRSAGHSSTLSEECPVFCSWGKDSQDPEALSVSPDWRWHWENPA
jgi:hypothetical protein